jgi:hypothetical protein
MREGGLYKTDQNISFLRNYEIGIRKIKMRWKSSQMTLRIVCINMQSSFRQKQNNINTLNI